MNYMSEDEKIVKGNFIDVVKLHFPDPPIDLSQSIETAYSRTAISARLNPELWEKLKAAGWDYDGLKYTGTIYEGFIVENGVLHCDFFFRATEETGWRFPEAKEREKQIIEYLRAFVNYFYMHITAHEEIKGEQDDG